MADGEEETEKKQPQEDLQLNPTPPSIITLYGNSSYERIVARGFELTGIGFCGKRGYRNQRINVSNARYMLLLEVPTYFKFSFSLQELIKSSFQDIVSDELKKMKETPMKSCSETLSADAETSDDMIWEYDGIHEAYQGECEEILLEMQKIFYEDLENEQIGKDSTIDAWEDEEDEYLARLVFENMQLNDDKVWMPNTLLKKEKVSCVPLWVKMHNVPIVAYSKVGLDVIAAKVGKLIRLDAHTTSICLNSWGRSDYARALVEISAETPLVNSVYLEIPLDDDNGHVMAKVDIEYEWQPPRCGTCKVFDHLEAMCPKKQSSYAKTPRATEDKGKQIATKAHGNTTKTPSPPDSSKNGKPNYISDDISFADVRKFVDKTMEEESILEYIGNDTKDSCSSWEIQDDKGSSKKPNSYMELITVCLFLITIGR
ncbi:RPA-interacting protein B [Tanacetum coccineum]